MTKDEPLNEVNYVVNEDNYISEDDSEERNIICTSSLETLRNTTRAGRQFIASIVDQYINACIPDEFNLKPMNISSVESITLGN